MSFLTLGTADKSFVTIRQIQCRQWLNRRLSGALRTISAIAVDFKLNAAGRALTIPCGWSSVLTVDTTCIQAEHEVELVN